MPDRDWQTHYESGTPPWETGQTSQELARVIAEQKIEPCRVIELGCGSGINAVWLAQQGFEVTALDFTPLAIEKARQRAAAAGVPVRFVQADVLNLSAEFEPFPHSTDSSITVEFDVFKPAGSTVTCLVRALDLQSSEVGRAEVPVTSTQPDANVVYRLAVTERPNTAEVASCRLDQNSSDSLSGQ
jgi:SAM-dependent methyltransferase